MLTNLSDTETEQQCSNQAIFRVILNNNNNVYACSRHTLLLAEYALAKVIPIFIDPIPYNDKEYKSCFIRVKVYNAKDT